MISVSFDIDWALDPVIEECLIPLEKAGISATFFATHESKILSDLDNGIHEVGIHPNFMPNFHGKGRPFKEVIDELLFLFPNSKGVRFHSLGYAAQIISYCKDQGLEYDSSVFLPMQVEPYRDDLGFGRVPFFRSDFQMILEKNLSLSLSEYNPHLHLGFCFHPIHIFLNTCSLKHYEDSRNHFRNFKDLKNQVNNSQLGIRDCFLKLISCKDPLNFVTLHDVYQRLMP